MCELDIEKRNFLGDACSFQRDCKFSSRKRSTFELFQWRTAPFTTLQMGGLWPVRCHVGICLVEEPQFASDRPICPNIGVLYCFNGQCFVILDGHKVWRSALSTIYKVESDTFSMVVLTLLYCTVAAVVGVGTIVPTSSNFPFYTAHSAITLLQTVTGIQLYGFEL